MREAEERRQNQPQRGGGLKARSQNQSQRGGGLKARLPFFKRQNAPESEYEEEEPAEDIPVAAAPEETAQDDAYEPDAAYEEADAYGASDSYEEAESADDEEDVAAGTVRSEDDDGYEDGYEEEETGDGEDDEDEERAPSKFKFDLSPLKNNKKLQIAIAAVLVLAVLIGGVRWLIYVTSSLGTKIAGVTHTTYSEGIKLIGEYTSDDYRSSRAEVAASNMAYAQQQMDEDMAKLSALMPAEPQDNDEVFVTTLTILHEGVQSVITKDAEAAANGAQAEREAASQQEWAVIQNAVSQLKSATAVTQLTTLAADVQAALIPQPTPAPTAVAPTPTPAPTPLVIREGVKDNDEVKRMQKRLIELGYLTGKADGDFGPKTGTALKAFQTAAGFTADGIATEEVLGALYAEDAPAATPTDAPDQAELTVIEV